MGHASSTPRLSRRQAREYAAATRFSEAEVRQWYARFVRNCSTARTRKVKTALVVDIDQPWEGSGDLHVRGVHAHRSRRVDSVSLHGEASHIQRVPRRLTNRLHLRRVPHDDADADADTDAPRPPPPPPTRQEPYLDRAALRGMYARFFPLGDPRRFADRMFCVMDTNGDGRVDFGEFLAALSIATGPSPADTAPADLHAKQREAERARLEFAFRLYDADNDGWITYGEVLDVVRAMDMMVGALVPPPTESAMAAVVRAGGRAAASLSMPRPAQVAMHPYSPDVAAPRAASTPPLLHEALPTPHAVTASLDRQMLSPQLYPVEDGALNTDTCGYSSGHEELGYDESEDLEDTSLEARVTKLFTLLDRNADGRISLQEFVDAARANPAFWRALNLYEGMAM